MTHKPIALKVDHLFFSYDKTPVLDNVHLSIHEGEFIGIFGPNGGGKTTLLKLLLGFLEPSKGTISVLGKSPKKVRTEVSYVPQIAKLDKQFPITVYELVLMGCLSKGDFLGRLPSSTKNTVLDALEKVDLLTKKDVPFGSLSGGQAQRALIARALVSKPKILLLDEPTASVDPKAEQEILHILSELKGTMTILMVTHDLQTIVQKVERLLCIHRHVHSFLPSEVCEHFGLGLYHTPLLQHPFKAGKS